MAVFKGMDSSLPVLTQVYQVNVEDVEELLHLISNLGHRPHPAHNSFFEIMSFSTSEEEFANKFSTAMVPDGISKTWLASTAALVRFTQSAMAGLFERQSLTRRQWAGLHHATLLYAQKSGIVFYPPYRWRRAVGKEYPIGAKQWMTRFQLKTSLITSLMK